MVARKIQMGLIRRSLLRASVHLQAFWNHPAAYMQGVGWRIRGLKLRSSHRFSALMGHTASAYDLWMASREPQRLAALPALMECGPHIVIVVDCRHSIDRLADTMASVNQLIGTPGSTILLGEPDFPGWDVQLALSTQDLARLFTEKAQRVWAIAISAGDTLSPHALVAYRATMVQHPEALLFYSDDDWRYAGQRRAPHFKPAWNEELVQHHDFVTGSCLFFCDPDRIDKSWPYNAMPLSFATPVHVPYVLHHRVRRPEPVKPVLMPNEIALPHVSIIVPTRDHSALLRTCIAGLDITEYPSFDVTIIDNGSCEPEAMALLNELRAKGFRIVRDDGPFNYAAMHNAVIPSVDGPLVCFLNNDIEVIDPKWLQVMAAQALDDRIGAVGARLLYPDRTIQHAGIVIGVGGGAGHAHRFQRDDECGYFERAHLPQYVSAVTAACMLVRKDRFLAVGGFNEQAFKVAFNDVDLCLKLDKFGWRNFYEPRACLIHHESKSRGLDRSGEKRLRMKGELEALKRLWSTDQTHDRWHHPELSQFSEQFVVRL